MKRAVKKMLAVIKYYPHINRKLTLKNYPQIYPQIIKKLSTGLSPDYKKRDYKKKKAD